MAKVIRTDEEIIDFLLEWFSEENGYAPLTDYIAVTMLEDNLNLHHKDGERIWRKLIKEAVIEPDKKGKGWYSLSDNGMSILRKHGTYSSYANQAERVSKRKEKVERDDRRVKNIGILATLGVSLLTLILTQCPTGKEKQSPKTEEGIQSVERKLDSLLRVLPQSPSEKEKQITEDTAKRK